jgi:4-aminobutyrate aminotransferase-like enzyme
VTAGSVIRLLPPLVIDQKQADAIVDTVCACIDEI